MATNIPMLKEYIAHALQLEKNMYSQGQLITSLKEEANKYAIPRRASSIEEEAQKIYQKNYHDDDGCLPIAVSAFLVGIFIILPISPFIVKVLCVVAVYFISKALVKYIERAAYNSNMQLARKQAEKIVSERTAIEEQRLEKEEVIKRGLQKELRSVEESLQQTRQALNSLYKMDIIHPDYRHIVALSSIYKYLDRGLCSELTGSHGAYNLFEEEVRFNIIYGKLDGIISRLDQINDNQRDVYDAINNTNRLLRNVSTENKKMISSMGRIENNTSLIEFNTSSSNYALQSLNAMAMWHELNDVH